MKYYLLLPLFFVLLQVSTNRITALIFLVRSGSAPARAETRSVLPLAPVDKTTHISALANIIIYRRAVLWRHTCPNYKCVQNWRINGRYLLRWIFMHTSGLPAPKASFFFFERTARFISICFAGTRFI